MSRDDKRKDLRLVKPREDVAPEALEEATRALRAAVAPAELEAADHEALIAMTLGEDVSDITDEERAQAEALRIELEAGGGGPLAELAGALRAAYLGAEVQEQQPELEAADNEVLIALALGEDASDISAEELTEAQMLRDALRGRGDHPLAELAGALRAAGGDAALADEDGEALIALTLGDSAAAVEPEEVQSAADLRRALDGEGSHPLAELAVALRAAAGKLRDLDELSHRRLVKRALDSSPAKAFFALGRKRRSAARQSTAMVVGAIVALAAGIALFVGSLGWLETRQGAEPVAQAPQERPTMIPRRSTAELFDPTTPFPATGGESERMAKIVTARAADLRANRFSAWGVR